MNSDAGEYWSYTIGGTRQAIAFYNEFGMEYEILKPPSRYHPYFYLRVNHFSKRKK